jgi:hypothetical protein
VLGRDVESALGGDARGLRRWAVEAQDWPPEQSEGESASAVPVPAPVREDVSYSAVLLPGPGADAGMIGPGDLGSDDPGDRRLRPQDLGI